MLWLSGVGKNEFSLIAWNLFLLLEMWTLYFCLRPLWKNAKEDRELSDPELVEKLLQRGKLPAGMIGAWGCAFLEGIVNLSTVGILFTVILGGLIAEKNALWEYDSTGLFAGLGILYFIQLACLPKAALLLEGIPLEKESGNAIIWMLIPGFAWIKSLRLLAKLERRKTPAKK